MICLGHLETYDVTLTTKAPVFVGSGRRFSKIDYLFDTDLHRVRVIDQNKLFDLLMRHNLADAFEAFVLSGKNDMRVFLDEQNISAEERDMLIRYEVEAANALNRDRTLKEISSFVRNAENHVYIPGTTIKGALRTALLFSMIEKGSGNFPLIDRRTRFPEGKYLNQLSFRTDKPWLDKAMSNMHSLMRGIIVSDSTVVDDRDMILCVKQDVSTRGFSRILNLCRECIRPNVTIRFTITLDRLILGDKITIETIREAIRSFAAYYKAEYESKFALSERTVAMNDENVLFLGGGVGFFSKTLVYPFLGKAALKPVSEYMGKSFRVHNHSKDVELGISPRTLKYASYQKKSYPMGLCEVEIT